MAPCRYAVLTYACLYMQDAAYPAASPDIAASVCVTLQGQLCTMQFDIVLTGATLFKGPDD